MTSTPIRAAATVLLGVALGGSLACTAIMAPRDDVERCSNVDDCPPTGDNRYVPECRFDEGNLDLDSTEVDKVCVPAYKKISCGIPTNANHPYTVAFEQLAAASRYKPCSETPGAQGCPPEPGVGCNEGLMPRQSDGICDDDNENTPPAYGITSAHGVPTDVLTGQDVKDQFCRSFFCDARFVCSDDEFCEICEGDGVGDGGCGQVYIEGAPSCAYQSADELEATCRDADASVDDPRFGDCG